MASKKYIFPSFDTLELTEAPEIAAATFVKLSPARAGAPVSALGDLHALFDEIIVDENASRFSYTYKSILLYFYGKEWGEISNGHLRQLNAFKNELLGHQVKPLIVTTGSPDNVKALIENDLSAAGVVEDPDNHLAKTVGLYADESPAWARYAGIETNVALPGLYLLDSTRRVRFAFPNERISADLPLYQLLEALPNRYHAEKRSA